MWPKCRVEMGWGAALALSTAAVGAAGCRRADMFDTGRVKPLQESTFFADGRSSRDPVPGTVARGQLRSDDLYYRGTDGGQAAAVFPFEVNEDVLMRGQSRFEVFCAPCHGRTGEGNGMIVQRGYRRPPTFHDDRLRKAPPGHLFDVVTNGFGAMPPYATEIPPRDRWAIAGYIRALQRSRAASIDDVPLEERAKLGGNP